MRRHKEAGFDTGNRKKHWAWSKWSISLYLFLAAGFAWLWPIAAAVIAGLVLWFLGAPKSDGGEDYREARGDDSAPVDTPC